MTPRFITVLAGMLVLQIALIVALNRSGDSLAAVKTATTLVAETQHAALKDIDRLLVEGPDEASVELKKRDGQWILPGYFDAPVDDAKLKRVLEALPQSKRGFAVATSTSALERFKVNDEAFERRITFEKSGETQARLYLGTSAGLRKLHARNAEDRAVYIVEFPYYDAPTEAANWFRRDLTQVPESEIQSISLNGQGFEDDKAKEIIQKITGLRAEAILGLEARPEWKEKLKIRLTLKDGEEQWILSQPEDHEDGNRFYVLKTPKHPWYIKLAYWDGDDLMDFIQPPQPSPAE